jgi:hypothetical protein
MIQTEAALKKAPLETSCPGTSQLFQGSISYGSAQWDLSASNI